MSATENTQPTLRERQRAERERLILEEAERMLSEEGYDGLVMDQLAENVGVSKGTLYQHFAKKEDLVGAIMKRGVERAEACVKGRLADTGLPAVERLSAVLTSAIGGQKAWMSTMGSPQRHELSASLREQPGLHEAIARLLDALCELIRQGQDSGELDTEIPAPVAARFLLSFARTHHRPVSPADLTVSLEEWASYAARLYFHGMCSAHGDCGPADHQHRHKLPDEAETAPLAGVTTR
jgi:TetR/AcrR family transcriptional regulator, fatty acid metabolism regulator protein